jgi:hypothetical protein
MCKGELVELLSVDIIARSGIVTLYFAISTRRIMAFIYLCNGLMCV